MTMFQSVAINLFYVIFSSLLWQCQMQITFKITVNEEAPIDTIIGNIQSFVSSQFYDISSYSVNCVSKHFTITSTKDVVVSKVIDLDRICDDENLCCNEGPCLIRSVVYLSVDQLTKHSFNIELEIQDINDNKPIFKNPNQTVFIPENSKVNTFMPLDGAVDKDVSPVNGVQSYRFVELTNTFQLDSTDLYRLKLFLQQPIDYEKKNFYTGILSACEAKSNCTSQMILITVTDVNDNLPKFEKHKYHLKVREDVPVHSTVLRVRAIDLDGPQFNRTRYSLAPTRGQSMSRYFSVDADTGDVVLKTRLSASSKIQYRFSVLAYDALLPRLGDSEDTTDVLIEVIDINDHKPAIELIRSEQLIEIGKTIRVRVRENEPAQQLVSMRVSDRDLDENGQVECSLKETPGPFEVKFHSPDLYVVSSVAPFDYEKDSVLRTLFECRDHGVPVQIEYRTIEVAVVDVNEFTPVFSSREYRASLMENTGPGHQVLKVNATDGDGSATLVYSLVDQATTAQYFSVDPDTGIVRTGPVSFDREQTASREFFIRVIDSKERPRSADVSVHVEIIDENDNSPRFEPRSLFFSVAENVRPPSVIAGLLNASDADRSEENSAIIFELIALYDHSGARLEPALTFRVRSIGRIETALELDRETNPNFTLTVRARDRGSPSRWSLANATVIVTDINDNRPVWQYPRLREGPLGASGYILDPSGLGSRPLPVLNISETVERGFLIMKVLAIDADVGEAARVSYELLDHHEEMFGLNASTGELVTLLSPLRPGQYPLRLSAHDHGSLPLRSEGRIVINVLVDTSRLAHVNLLIVVGMIAVTVLISLFLVVAIVCVRRRPQLHKYWPPNPPNGNATETACLGLDDPNTGTLQQHCYFTMATPSAGGQGHNHQHWMYRQPTDDGDSLPVMLGASNNQGGDGDSYVFMGSQHHQVDPLAALQMLGSTGGSRPGSRMDYPLALPSSNNFTVIDSSNTGGTGNNDRAAVLQINPNSERLNGTLRSNNGFYGSNMISSSMGIVLNGQELDGDSADSGKGASEVDLRLQQLNIGNRNYPTMPFPHYSTATTTFGHYSNMAPNQYYSINTNPRSPDSRYLTVNTAHLTGGGRRVASPSNSNCQCFMLPEAEDIHISQESPVFPMSTFSGKSRHAANHDKSCVHNVDELPSSGDHFYADYPYGESSAIIKDFSLMETSNEQSMLEKRDLDIAYNENATNKNNLFTISEKNCQEKNNFYSLGMAN